MKKGWVADVVVRRPGAGFVIPPRVVRAWFVITLCGGQGWVCYPAAGAGLGLLSRCCTSALIAIVWLRQGWVCYPAVGAGLGLLSRCWSRAGFVIPLLYVWL